MLQVDCINAEDETRGHRQDIIRLSSALDRVAKRDVLFSLSPGGFSNISQLVGIRPYVSMARVTDDFWDNWQMYMNEGGGGGYASGYSHWDAARDLVAAVRNSAPTFYIDLDMLPFGRIGSPRCSQQSPVGPGCARQTRYTVVEQQAIFTLWSMVQAPMIIGADVTTVNAGTRALLTNAALKGMSEAIGVAWEARRANTTAEGYVAWRATSKVAAAAGYVAVFNLWNATQAVAVPWLDLGLPAGPRGGNVTDLWTATVLPAGGAALTATLPAHGVLLISV